MDIILVVYDMGDRDSFDAAVMWLELVAFTGSVHTVVLVANKYEKAFASRRCVPTAEGREAAEQWNALYTEASSEQPLRKVRKSGVLATKRSFKKKDAAHSMRLRRLSSLCATHCSPSLAWKESCRPTLHFPI